MNRAFSEVNDKRATLQRAYIILDNQTRVLAALKEADETGMLSSENWELSHGLQEAVANDIVENCAQIAKLSDELDPERRGE